MVLVIFVTCHFLLSESPNKRRVQVSTETDHGDDDLDLSALQIETVSAHLTDHTDSGDGEPLM